MSAQPQLVFIKFGRFSFTNGRIEQFLRASFPEFDLETIDVASYLRRHRLITAIAILGTMLRCRRQLWDGRRPFRAALMHGLVRSPYLRRRVAAYLEHTIPHRFPRARLILVSQTLFGCNIPAIPTYIYTDSAALTNLYTDGFVLADLPPSDWLTLEAAFLHSAARIFTWSHHVTHSLRELYHLPAARVDRLLAGCNLQHLPAQPNPPPPDNKTILFVGVDWQRKGGPLLIEAFRRLPPRHADANLLIAGCALPLQIARCKVLGRVALADIGACYARAAIFCLPTRSEPFGIAFIEAMSHACAAVAPRMGAMPDYIDHGVSGLLHRPGDIDDILQQLTWLLDHPQARQAIARSGYAAVQEYRWEKVGRRMRESIAADFAANKRDLI
jgi:glycosyltransferase involved in cell wall biosynthesis